MEDAMCSLINIQMANFSAISLKRVKKEGHFRKYNLEQNGIICWFRINQELRNEITH